MPTDVFALYLNDLDCAASLRKQLRAGYGQQKT